jgi:hypothetical protein
MKAPVRVQASLALALSAAVFAASACAKKEPPPPPPEPTAMPTVEVPTPVPAARLDKITVTKSVNATRAGRPRPASAKDTVYVSRWCRRSVRNELKASWTIEGNSDQDKIVTDKKRARVFSEFHAAKSGWASGPTRSTCF